VGILSKHIVVADIEVDKVANKVADMMADKKDINIQFGERVG